MKKSILICIAICLTVLVTSCGEELDDKYEYLALKPELSVSESSISVEGTEQSYRIQINCNTYWTATTNTNWVHLDAYGGKGKGSLYINVETNPSSTSERIGDFNISDGIKTIKVSVTQAPIPVTLNVSKSSMDFTYKGGSSSVNVSSNMDWTASSDAKWCTLSISATGITVNVQANNSYSPRTATITVSSGGASTPIKVNQSEVKEPTLGNLTVSDITKTTANCSFTFNSSDLSVIKYGVSYGLTENSLTNDVYTSSSSYSGTASYNLSGLTQNTTYYIRPYVETSIGITYGNTITFTTLSSNSPNENDNPTPNY